MKFASLLCAVFVFFAAISVQGSETDSNAKFFRNKIYFGSQFRLVPSEDDEILERTSFARGFYLIHPLSLDLDAVLIRGMEQRSPASEEILPEVSQLVFFSITN